VRGKPREGLWWVFGGYVIAVSICSTIWSGSSCMSGILNVVVMRWCFLLCGSQLMVMFMISSLLLKSLPMCNWISRFRYFLLAGSSSSMVWYCWRGVGSQTSVRMLCLARACWMCLAIAAVIMGVLLQAVYFFYPLACACARTRAMG
jgi:hypothetical protein